MDYKLDGIYTILSIASYIQLTLYLFLKTCKRIVTSMIGTHFLTNTEEKTAIGYEDVLSFLDLLPKHWHER